MLSRFRALIGAALVMFLVVLTACAPSSSSGGDGGPGNLDVAQGGTKFSTADQETAKLGTDAAPGEFPRTITDSMGTVTLEKKPERVVVLDGGELDSVLALGVTPVGMAEYATSPNGESYLKDRVAEIPVVGDVKELNLEAIAALKPDLILGSSLRAEKMYPALSKIAPTVFAIRPGFPWKENFLLIGDALGEETKAVQILNDYQDKANAVRDSVSNPPTISLLRFMPEKIRLYANKSFAGVILKDAGIPRPANQDIDDLAAEISPENVSDAEADLILYSSYGDPSGTAEESVVNGALFQNLAAVKAGNAKRISDDVWFLALGPIGANLVLDDLQNILKEYRPA